MNLEEAKKAYERMEANIREVARLNEKVKYYKKVIKKGEFKLNPEFETDLTAIKLSDLKTELDEVIIDIAKNYEVVFLDLDKVVSKHVSKPDKIYPKDKLWVKRSPHNIARLIEFIEAGNKLIPAIIEPLNQGEDLAIIDGNHRIALFRYLRLGTIPFFVRKDLLEFVSQLK